MAGEYSPNWKLGQGGSPRLGLFLIFSTTLLLVRCCSQAPPLSSLGKSSLFIVINCRDAVSRETESQPLHALWMVWAFCPGKGLGIGRGWSKFVKKVGQRAAADRWLPPIRKASFLSTRLLPTYRLATPPPAGLPPESEVSMEVSVRASAGLSGAC